MLFGNSIVIVLFLRRSNGFHLAGFSFFFTWVNCFFHTGKPFSVIQYWCLIFWVFHGVAEVAGACFYFENLPNSWFGHTWCFCYLSDGFGSIYFQPNNTLLRYDWQLFGSYRKRFIWLLTCFLNEGIDKICPWNSFWADYPSTFGPLTRGRHILTAVITIHLIWM